MTSTNDKQHRHNAKPTKHATIMRGVVAPIFGLLTVLFIVLGALNLTVWKPAREINATTSVSGTRYVVTDAGMLNLLGKSVDIKVSTQGNQPKASSKSNNSNTKNAKATAQTCVALGNAKDATGWLAGQNYTRVTGLDGWKGLSTKLANGPKLGGTQAGDEVAFKDSDMWTNVKCGDSAISMNLNDVKNDQVMIVDMGTGVAKSESAKKFEQPSVTITMHWVRDQVPNHAMPFFIAAGVCVVLTILSASIFAIMANESFKRKRAKRREVREKAKAEEVSISEAMTGSIAVLKTSLTHSSHNHRPSHKIQPSDLAGAGSADVTSNEGDTGAAPDNGSLLPTSSEGGLSDVDVSTPSIIDPTRRNLVADMQMQNDTDENADNEPGVAEKDAAQSDASDSQTQAFDGTSGSRNGETTESRTTEPQGSGEPTAATQGTSGQGSQGADIVSADEGNPDMSWFARHRGKPEPESESDRETSQPVVGRHSRHAVVNHANDDSSVDQGNADKYDNRDHADQLDNADNRDNATNSDNRDGGDRQDTDFRTASVAVSLERPEGDVEPGNGEHAEANDETRTASSADELIDEGHAQAETTVISADELRDYFARFSSETSDDDTNGEAEGAEVTSSEASGDTSGANGDGENA
ncbi:MAG: hypothetical protein J6575_05980 [Bifidobacterium sp.]|nr:hypothetical protein [Bifidobacterium sp.]